MQLQRCLTIVIIAVCSLSAPLAWGQEAPQVMATVNGEPIMSDRFQEELLRRWGDVALGALVSQMAIEQAAAAAGVTVTDAEIDQRVENFQRNIDLKAPMTGESFSLWLARQKMTMYAFRQWMRTELLVEKMVAAEATVSEEDVRAVYDAARESLRQPERMRISHICVKTKEEAERIRAEIVGGKPFEEAAREYSIDPYTRDNGGAFGTVTRSENPFQKAAFALKADAEMSEPVQTQMGWHIIRRDEYLPESIPEYDEVKDEIRERLEQQKLIALMSRKRAEIMQNAHIEYEISPTDLLQ
jgi:foldase protein PrsA